MSACPEEGSSCRYGDVLCRQCTPCADPNDPATDDPLRWACTSPDPGCPRFYPVEGEQCDLPEETYCSGYDRCFSCGPWAFEGLVICRDRRWFDSHADCQP